MSPYRIKILMPCYLVIDGKKQEMDEDIFDQMVEALHQPTTPNNTPRANQSRWKQPGALFNDFKKSL